MDDIPVLGIHEIAFEVRDLDRSIAFYRDILGLPLVVARAAASLVLYRNAASGVVYS
jgi:catechol 2,3-dioxygenase-like lactoylglutathione lyase family enzyme